MKDQNFLFGDIETGGLNGRLENGKLGMEYYPIFELAFVLTDTDLEPIGEPLVLVVHQSESEIAKSDPWALEAHTKSGLLKKVRQSDLSLEQAENKVLELLHSHGIESYDRKSSNGVIFVGNSIMLDRDFMLCQMPKIHNYMHYRQLDISSLALAARAWKPELEKDAIAHKKYSHEALADIQESIDELKVYKRFIEEN
ncbi:MAG: oligoribonuclease [Endozoicomonadaceae bacterium]|nr:oligoribonuclease [Endozoicomonadaceae bacterium]